MPFNNFWEPKVGFYIPSDYWLTQILGVCKQSDVPQDLLIKLTSNANPYASWGESRRLHKAGIGFDPDATKGRNLMKVLPAGADIDEHYNPNKIWTTCMADHSQVAQFLSCNAGSLNRAATCDKVQDFLASQWTIVCIQEANAESTLHNFRGGNVHCIVSHPLIVNPVSKLGRQEKHTRPIYNQNHSCAYHWPRPHYSGKTSPLKWEEIMIRYITADCFWFKPGSGELLKKGNEACWRVTTLHAHNDYVKKTICMA